MNFEKYIKKINEDLDELNSIEQIEPSTTEDDQMNTEVIDVTNGSTDDLVIDKASVMDEIHELLEKLDLDSETVIELSKQIADKAGVGWSEEDEEEREELSGNEGDEELEEEDEEIENK